MAWAAEGSGWVWGRKLASASLFSPTSDWAALKRFELLLARPQPRRTHPPTHTQHSPTSTISVRGRWGPSASLSRRRMTLATRPGSSVPSLTAATVTRHRPSVVTESLSLLGEASPWKEARRGVVGTRRGRRTRRGVGARGVRRLEAVAGGAAAARGRSRRMPGVSSGVVWREGRGLARAQEREMGGAESAREKSGHTAAAFVFPAPHAAGVRVPGVSARHALPTTRPPGRRHRRRGGHAAPHQCRRHHGAGLPALGPARLVAPAPSHGDVRAGPGEERREREGVGRERPRHRMRATAVFFFCCWCLSGGDRLVPRPTQQ